MDRSRETNRVLLDKAWGDLAMLQQLLEHDEIPDWGIGFHAQQAAEKAIKAVLSSLSIDYPRTHNIGFLLDLLPGKECPLPPDALRLPELTPYGTVTRYADPWDDDPSELRVDRAWAVGAVQRTLDWASMMLRRTEEER
jgi:HEPN domain-containing protein